MSRESRLLLRSLRALARGEGLADTAGADAFEIDTVIASGLGPLVHHLLVRGGATLPPVARPLQAAELTSRVLTAELRNGVAYALAALDSHRIEATLLKGIAFSTRYYAEPHLRVMGDVDLLLPAGRVEAGVAALLDAGFVMPEEPGTMDVTDHIHAPGMFHPERELWIELHRSLILPAFAASAEAPLNLENLGSYQYDGRFGDLRVKYLRPEFELVYMAVGWCRDLTDGCGDPGLRRAPFDAVALLRAADTFDWDLVRSWSRNTLTGACVYVLLSYLARHGVLADAPAVLPRIRATQTYVNAASLKAVHLLIDRYLLGMRRFGPLASTSNVGNLFDALIAPRPAWRNLLAAPANLVFPRREPRRFNWRYQLGRLGTVFGKR